MATIFGIDFRLRFLLLLFSCKFLDDRIAKETQTRTITTTIAKKRRGANVIEIAAGQQYNCPFDGTGSRLGATLLETLLATIVEQRMYRYARTYR